MFIYHCAFKFQSLLASTFFLVGLVGHHFLKYFSEISILLDNFQISKSKAALVRAHTLQPIVQMLYLHAFRETLDKYPLVLATCN